MLSDAAAFGIDPSDLSDALIAPANFEVWPEHVAAVQMFLRCQTQWRTSPNGVIGLDYGVMLQLADLYNVEDRRQLLEDLQVMEAKALQLVRDQSEKAAKAVSAKNQRAR